MKIGDQDSMIRKLPVAVVLRVSAVLLAVFFGITGSQESDQRGLRVAATTGDVAGVQAAAEKALLVNQEIQRTPDQDPKAPPAAAAPSEAAFQRQQADNIAAIDSIFAGDAATRAKFALDNAIKAESAAGDHFRVVDAGIGTPEFFSTVAVDAVSASVAGTVEIWSRMQFKNPDGKWHVSEPHNIIQFKMFLTKNGTAGWIVQKFTSNFTVGHGP